MARWLIRCTPVLVVLLAGCTVAPSAPTAPAPPPPGLPQPSPTPQPPAGPEPSLTLALYDQADAARRRGDYDSATTTLERAIRIDPDAPELWLLLGQVNLDTGDPQSAEQFARKALRFVGNRTDLEQRAWSLIDQAKAAERLDPRRPDS